MKIIYRYLSLFLLFSLLTLPVGAESNVVSNYGNFTEDLWSNATQNVSQNYSYSDSNLTDVAAEEDEGYGEISPNSLVENVTFLTNSPESELFPVWTADGNHIMYTVHSNGSESFESYIMTANGSDIERTGSWEGNFTGFNDMNPNGTELILTKSIGSQTGLYLASLENGTVSRVADDPDKSEGWGAWCRLGRKIIYTQKSGNDPSQLWIVDRDGSNKNRLGTSENVGTGKDWCPLGLKVIYSARNSKEKPDLWTIEWYGTNQTQLTDTPYGEWNPSFSPDGKRIVYVSDEDGKPEIWLRDTEGKYKIRLTNNIGLNDSTPKWSPDGSKIVFAARNLHNILDNYTMNSSDSVLLNSSNSFMIENNSVITNNSTIGDISVITNNSTTGDLPVITSNSTTENSSLIANNSTVGDSSVTAGLDSTLWSGLNNSTTSGSDIVVIKLGPTPSVSSIPTNTSVKTDSVSETSEEGAVNNSIATKNDV